jgi:SAM-dependent methyltransferase
MTRALSFGAIAAAYERYRPGYPPELLDLVVAYAKRPLRTALEIGAGTGKATRLFAGGGIRVTATEPDAAMLAVLRANVPPGVRALRAAFEDLPPFAERFDCLYAAAALHWTDPRGRWPKVAALLNPGGVVASFGGPIRPSEPTVAEAISRAQAPFLATAEIPSPDGTPEDHPMQWPGTEMRDCGLFTDVEQHVIERHLTMSAHDYLGHLSTVSAYLQLPAADRTSAFARIAEVLPDPVGVTADIVAHLARRRR